MLEGSGRFLFVRLNSRSLGYHLDATRNTSEPKIRLRPSIAAALRARGFYFAVRRPRCPGTLRAFQVELPAACRQFGKGSAKRFIIEDVVCHRGASDAAADHAGARRHQPKRKVVETFDNIADAYKRLRRLQDQDIQNKLRNDSLSPAQERRYKKLKDDIIAGGEVAAAQPCAHRCAGRFLCARYRGEGQSAAPRARVDGLEPVI